jgi:hypothetical protein
MNLSLDINLSRLHTFIHYIKNFYVALQLASTEQSISELGLERRVEVMYFDSCHVQVILSFFKASRSTMCPPILLFNGNFGFFV